MTAEERATAAIDAWWASQGDNIGKLSELPPFIAQAIREAEAAEREACAQVVEDEPDVFFGGWWGEDATGTRRACAAAIRARGGEGEG